VGVALVAARLLEWVSDNLPGTNDHDRLTKKNFPTRPSNYVATQEAIA